MSDSRLDEIVEVLMAYARQDFSPRLAVSPALDEIDAIATGVNLLAEELDGEVASRRELETAYARLQATQAQLVLAEKFAAVGQLANGVAHELNNPATWVKLGVDAARRRLAHAKQLAGASAACLAELDAIDESLTDVHAGIERMRAVVCDLRTLARADTDQPSLLELDTVVRSACQLARPAYLSVATLVLDLAGGPVVGDRSSLGQIVTNLVINAAHAVAEGSALHEIVVSTRVEGETVVLAVDDTGPGIPDGFHERVFEPYFTTKPTEIGTGLGLTLVRKVAERHGGSARALPGTRGGARIEVRLPRADASRLDLPVAAAAATGAAKAHARMLLVDDEPMLVRALAQAIEDEHDVVPALGGQAALDLLATDRAFDLIVCDLQMPGVDGVTVHDAIAAHYPELVGRLVIMSGGAVTPRATRFLERERPRVIGKPIVLDHLLGMLRDAIAR